MKTITKKPSTKRKVKALNKHSVNGRLRPKQILKMLIEWHDATEKYEGEYVDWWKKYPSYSLRNVIDEARATCR